MKNYGMALACAFLLSLAACQRATTKQNLNAPQNWALAAAPQARAHAHNDYEHEHPLYDALAFGFTSIEADIYLAGEELYVGHQPKELRKERTLAALYLEPLRQIVAANGGNVYAAGLPLVLLIDIKTDADNTYRALRRELQKYEAMLTTFEPELVKPNAVLVIVSGRRPRVLMEHEKKRYAAYDGRWEDLDTAATSAFMPLVSGDWAESFSWQGEGEMPAAERDKLQQLVARVHAQGRRLRFWNTPDAATSAREAVWRELVAHEVDLIGTDDLAGLHEFLQQQP